MHFQLLSIPRDDRRIKEEREDSTKELIVNLDPLDAEADGLACRRIAVHQPDAAERRIQQFDHVSVDERDADAFERQIDRESDRSLLLFCLKLDIAGALARCARHGHGCVASLQLEKTLRLVVIGDAEQLVVPLC